MRSFPGQPNRRRRPRNDGPAGALPAAAGPTPKACVWCGAPHAPTFLCEPAGLRLAQILAASAAGAADVPDGMTAQALGDGDRIIRLLVVNAAVTEVAGQQCATLIITGTDVEGRSLPRWVIIESDEVVTDVAAMISERASTAVDGARAARAERYGDAGGPPALPAAP